MDDSYYKCREAIVLLRINTLSCQMEDKGKSMMHVRTAVGTCWAEVMSDSEKNPNQNPPL